ncbi:hypothetical protein CTRI78_v004393 [Colletotrichum trifolii]|uniref:Uncharacterized protein n=1 Tax=Colletotrichum trifolii TaxID=5466 RepID=A0A4R8RTV0_COLTR|nr:hypothetical protein CTRI78_v004393 [Colletotrichum trifolii]
MKRRDSGAGHPFDAAEIPQGLPRHQSLLEIFWNPSLDGLASISSPSCKDPQTLPTHTKKLRARLVPPSLQLLVRDVGGGTPFWPLLPGSDAQLHCATAARDMATRCHDADPR